MKLYNLYNPMQTTVLKLFGTGQVTLPKKWRTQFKTKYYTAMIEDNKIILMPLEEEKVFFDADEFNDGKGIEINAFYKTLKKVLK